jgi:hypothetical protein
VSVLPAAIRRRLIDVVVARLAWFRCIYPSRSQPAPGGSVASQWWPLPLQALFLNLPDLGLSDSEQLGDTPARHNRVDTSILNFDNGPE